MSIGAGVWRPSNSAVSVEVTGRRVMNAWVARANGAVGDAGETGKGLPEVEHPADHWGIMWGHSGGLPALSAAGAWLRCARRYCLARSTLVRQLRQQGQHRQDEHAITPPLTSSLQCSHQASRERAVRAFGERPAIRDVAAGAVKAAVMPLMKRETISNSASSAQAPRSENTKTDMAAISTRRWPNRSAQQQEAAEGQDVSADQPLRGGGTHPQGPADLRGRNTDVQAVQEDRAARGQQRDTPPCRPAPRPLPSLGCCLWRGRDVTSGPLLGHSRAACHETHRFQSFRFPCARMHVRKGCARWVPSAPDTGSHWELRWNSGT